VSLDSTPKIVANINRNFRSFITIAQDFDSWSISINLLYFCEYFLQKRILLCLQYTFSATLWGIEESWT
jgi:hypothetical protein